MKAPEQSIHTMMKGSRIISVVGQLLVAHSGHGHGLSAKMVHVKNNDDAQVSEAYDASKSSHGCGWIVCLGIYACVHLGRNPFVPHLAVKASDLLCPDRPTPLLCALSIFKWQL